MTGSKHLYMCLVMYTYGQNLVFYIEINCKLYIYDQLSVMWC